MKRTLWSTVLLCLAALQAWGGLRAEQPAQTAKSEPVEVVEISFDVKLASFMSVEKVEIRTEWGADGIYDETSGLFKLRMPKADYPCRYEVSYWWEEPCFPKTGTFISDRDQTILVDMSNYRSVVFTTNDPDKWAWSSVSVSEKASTEGSQDILERSVDTQMYMGPGEYLLKVGEIRSQVDNLSFFGGLVMPFTVGDKDMEVVYQVKPENYHKVTFSMTDRDGNPMDESLYVYSLTDDNVVPSYGQGLGSEGKLTLLMHDGTYECKIGSSLVYYDSRFVVEGKDVDVKGTMSSDYRKLNVRVFGDLLSEFCDGNGFCGIPDFRIGTLSDGNKSVMLGGNADLGFSGSTYLLSGTYVYGVQMNHFGRQIKSENNVLELNGDYELEVELSSDKYGTVSFEVLDAEGNPLDNPGQLNLRRSGSSHDIYVYASSTDIFYLPAGTYCSVYGEGDERYVNEFTVIAGERSEVTIRLEERELVTVKVNVKLPPEVLSYYQECYEECGVDFYEPISDARIAGAYIDLNAPEEVASIELPKGTYTYELWPEELNRKEIINVQEDMELTIDFTAEPYLHITLLDESGVPFEPDHAGCYIHQKGQNALLGGTETFAFLEPGTYDLWVEAVFDDYSGASLQRTVTMGTSTQELNITVPKSDPNNFFVTFSVTPIGGYSSDLCGVVTLNGMTALLNNNINLFFADIPAGSYPYTIEAEGYETYTGTVVLNESVAEEHFVIVEAYLLPEKSSTGMHTPVVANRFRVYPTVAEDVLHIAPVSDNDGEWMVRLVSSSGMTVYSDMHCMDTEVTISVAGLPEGLYLLCMDNGKVVETCKILKK